MTYVSGTGVMQVLLMKALLLTGWRFFQVLAFEGLTLDSIKRSAKAF